MCLLSPPRRRQRTREFWCRSLSAAIVFPSLETTYSNLFYSCNCCNSRKKSFWPTAAQLRDKKFIPNPCDHIMFEHLQYRRAEVTLKSPAGKQADDILDLNDDDSVKYREFVLDLVDTLEKGARELIALVRGIEGQMKQFPERKQKLEEEKNSVEADLKKTREHLARLVQYRWLETRARFTLIQPIFVLELSSFLFHNRVELEKN